MGRFDTSTNSAGGVLGESILGLLAGVKEGLATREKRKDKRDLVAQRLALEDRKAEIRQVLAEGHAERAQSATMQRLGMGIEAKTAGRMAKAAGTTPGIDIDAEGNIVPSGSIFSPHAPIGYTGAQAKRYAEDRSVIPERFTPEGARKEQLMANTAQVMERRAKTPIGGKGRGAGGGTTREYAEAGVIASKPAREKYARDQALAVVIGAAPHPGTGERVSTVDRATGKRVSLLPRVYREYLETKGQKASQGQYMQGVGMVGASGAGANKFTAEDLVNSPYEEDAMAIQNYFQLVDVFEKLTHPDPEQRGLGQSLLEGK